MGLVVDFIGMVIKCCMMTGEPEECFQLVLRETSCTNPGMGRQELKEGRAQQVRDFSSK